MMIYSIHNKTKEGSSSAEYSAHAHDNRDIVGFRIIHQVNSSFRIHKSSSNIYDVLNLNGISIV